MPEVAKAGYNLQNLKLTTRDPPQERLLTTGNLLGIESKLSRKEKTEMKKMNKSRERTLVYFRM